jgi:peptidoglycan/LPS O-acetylase OafA/YrhL
MAGERERVPALDGVRGLAILLVLVHHLIPFHHATSPVGQVFNGVTGMGWSGVDLFFVLSGFLITGILINARSSVGYFRNFYARRTLRIFPLYYSMVLVSVVLGPALFPRLHTHPSASAGWWWFYLSNVPGAMHPDGQFGWLGVFWSLAVEEHFYLVWPAVVLICSDRTLARICLAVAGAGWTCRAVFDHFGWFHAGYSLTPCRMDALAYGGLVAIAVRSPSCVRFARPALAAAVGLGILAAAALVWRHSIIWDGVTQLVTVPLVDLTCALSIFVVSLSATGGPALLRSRGLRLLGKYSYGIYVFHGPVAELVGPRIAPLTSRLGSFGRADDLFGFVLLSAATCAVAFVSWHLFEMPFIRLKRYFPQSHALSIAPAPGPPASACGRCGAAPFSAKPFADHL